MSPRNLFASVVAPIAAGAVLVGVFLTLSAAPARPQPATFEATDVTGVPWGREFHLTGHDGKPHELAEFRGKVVALYFGYTRCPDVCPLTLATLGQGIERLGEDGRRVQVVFVTVDPKRDKPKVLAKYVQSFHEGFLGLYGNATETARAADEFKVEAGEHHSVPVFLIDPNGRLRLVAHPETSAESFAHDMRELLLENWQAG